MKQSAANMTRFFIPVMLAVLTVLLLATLIAERTVTRQLKADKRELIIINDSISRKHQKTKDELRNAEMIIDSFRKRLVKSSSSAQ